MNSKLIKDVSPLSSCKGKYLTDCTISSLISFFILTPKDTMKKQAKKLPQSTHDLIENTFKMFKTGKMKMKVEKQIYEKIKKGRGELCRFYQSTRGTEDNPKHLKLTPKQLSRHMRYIHNVFDYIAIKYGFEQE